VPRLAIHSFSKAIEIPASLHDQPLDTWQTSARLTAVLGRFGIRVLGDLNGRKVVDFAWEKNCGPKTLYELGLLARRARFRNGKAPYGGHRRGYAHASYMPSRSLGEGDEVAMGDTRGCSQLCHSGIGSPSLFARIADIDAFDECCPLDRRSDFGRF
jgi:hypothetical protein